MGQIGFKEVGAAYETELNTYRLTHNANYIKGAIWHDRQINLRDRFELHFELMLGCDNFGGDGIAFIFQQSGQNIIGQGDETMGYGGIQPALIVEFDTKEAEYDEVYDHLALMYNGPNHDMPDQNIAGPVAANVERINIEDCKNHKAKVIWEPDIKMLKVYFDGHPRLTYHGDLVSEFFNHNPYVYWGFTASTGCTTNTHSVKIMPTPPEPLIVKINIEQPECGSGGGGAAKVTTNRWGSRYSCKWSHGESSPFVSNLAAGDYTVTVTNEWGEQLAESMTIKDSSPIEVDVNPRSLEIEEIRGGQEPYQSSQGYIFVIGAEAEIEVDTNYLEFSKAKTMEFEKKKNTPNPRENIEEFTNGEEFIQFAYIEVKDANECSIRKYFPADEKSRALFNDKPIPSLDDVPIETQPLPEIIPEVVEIKMPELKVDSTQLGSIDLPITYQGDQPVLIGNRTIEDADMVTVDDRVIKIAVWDTEEIDGDIVSLNFNGKWILDKYKLKRKKKKLRVQIVPNQDNYLILYAHNEGSRPPNTAAFTIIDSRGKKHIALSSDLNSCGTLNFNYMEEVKEKK